jgi:hypothetical protein
MIKDYPPMATMGMIGLPAIRWMKMAKDCAPVARFDLALRAFDARRADCIGWCDSQEQGSSREEAKKPPSVT